MVHMKPVGANHHQVWKRFTFASDGARDMGEVRPDSVRDTRRGMYLHIQALCSLVVLKKLVTVHLLGYAKAFPNEESLAHLLIGCHAERSDKCAEILMYEQARTLNGFFLLEK